MKLLVILNNIIVITLLLLINDQKLAVYGDLYSSTEELSQSSDLKRNIDLTLDKLIEREENRLSELKTLKKTFNEFYNVDNSNSTSKSEASTSGKPINEEFFHPVKAFTELNHLVTTIEQLEEIANERIIDTDYDTFKQLLDWYDAPDRNDLVGAGEALLRLQMFYNLDSSDIALGRLFEHPSVPLRNSSASKNVWLNEPQLRPEDCLELGKIAYDKELYDTAIIWLGVALEMYGQKGLIFEDANPSVYSQVNELIEYMAFSSYQKNELELALRLTEALLERDPYHERALENLEYYREELDKENEGMSTDRNNIEESSSPKHEKFYYKWGESFNASTYVLDQDHRVRELCRKSYVSDKSKKCSREYLFTNHMIEPEIKMEILKTNPLIFRIHDIITEYEAEHLKKSARPNLLRSTVRSRHGAVASSYRIAKTAWLSRDNDPIVARLEERLSGLLNLDFTESESLQVVNYGIGGFYGPHMDSSRDSKHRSGLDNSTDFDEDDRLATILIYLNPVEAGGSTVFPKLGLTVEPIERSAVVWYNILKSGLPDERTLHTGCPILFGSKWIATFWPRERANTFRSLCPSRRDNLTN